MVAIQLVGSEREAASDIGCNAGVSDLYKIWNKMMLTDSKGKNIHLDIKFFNFDLLTQ